MQMLKKICTIFRRNLCALARCQRTAKACLLFNIFIPFRKDQIKKTGALQSKY
jgi:hypothetical protein